MRTFSPSFAVPGRCDRLALVFPPRMRQRVDYRDVGEQAQIHFGDHQRDQNALPANGGPSLSRRPRPLSPPHPSPSPRSHSP